MLTDEVRMAVFNRCDLVRLLFSALALLALRATGNAAEPPPTSVRQLGGADYLRGMRAEKQRHYRPAMALLKTAARAGSSDAMYEVGRLYF